MTNPPFHVPLNAEEEFAAAIEASIGDAFTAPWSSPMERPAVKEALDHLLLSPRPDRGLDALVRAGIMESILPEVQAMVGFGEGIRHKDVWEHTKKVVIQAPARLNVRWAALLHDIGKVPTRRFEPDGQVTFIGHPTVGARMFHKISRRLGFEKSDKSHVRFLIAEHLRASAYDGSWTDSAVRRFDKEMDAHLGDLLDLSRADITSKYAEKVRRGIGLIDALEERVMALRVIDAKPAPLPKGLGNILIDQLGIAPGPGLGRVMKRLKAEVESGNLPVQAPFDDYIAFLKTNPQIVAENS